MIVIIVYDGVRRLRQEGAHYVCGHKIFANKTEQSRSGGSPSERLLAVRRSMPEGLSWKVCRWRPEFAWGT